VEPKQHSARGWYEIVDVAHVHVNATQHGTCARHRVPLDRLAPGIPDFAEDFQEHAAVIGVRSQGVDDDTLGPRASSG